MPLYACERCGFTSAAFRSEAANAHRREYPDCDGVVRIIFRSEERYRGPLYLPPTASPSAAVGHAGPAPPGVGEGQAPPGKPDRTFALRETVDPDQALRLVLLGDLDLSAVAALDARLGELKAVARPTRLDLSQLAFIDSSGIQALLLALTDARWNGWPLDVAPEVSPSVERAAHVVGIAQVLWPQGRGPSQTSQTSQTTLGPAGTA